LFRRRDGPQKVSLLTDLSWFLKMTSTRDDATKPIAGIDRIALTSTADLAYALDTLSDFRTVSDHALKNVNDGFFRAPYGRVRRLRNSGTKTEIFIQYQPRFRRMAPVRVVVVPADLPGLRRGELERILSAFVPFRLSIVEVRLDFRRGS
jgi:hypothetical protein